MATKKTASKNVKVKAPVVSPETEAPVEAEPEVQPEAPVAEQAPVEPTPAVPLTGATEVTVCDPRGNPHRTYSLERHGEGFRELAEQYLSHKPGWTAR